MKKIFLFLFFGVSAGELLSTLVEISWLHTLCKPALMVTLGLYYLLAKREQQEPTSVVVLLAILFSCAGDVLLMFQAVEQLYFMLGLASFLIAHLFFIVAYRQHRNEDSSHALHGIQKVRYSFPIVFAGVGLVSIFYDHLGDLRIPVIIYSTVLALMVISALYRFGRTSVSSFAMVFGGAVLFMISDSMLAINKFMEQLPLGSFWIMLTYVLAEFFIIEGLTRHKLAE